jgi:hypothetical protein
MLKINLTFNTGKQTIAELSYTLYKIMKGLANIDAFFSIPVLRQEKFDDVEIDLSFDENIVVSNIAATILCFFKKDILKYEKDDVSSINYSRDFGFITLLQYREAGSEISFTCNLGSASINSLGQLSNNGFELTPELGERILRKLVTDDDLKVVCGAVKVSDMDFLRASKLYVYSLGLITYFSNDYEIPIPDYLEGIEYEHTDKGKYLFLAKEYLVDDEKKKQKLLEIMEEIKRRVPEYSK